MRLAAVTVSTMKRYAILVAKNGGKPADEDDVSSILGMHAEVCRTLLQMVKHGVRNKVLGTNLHLVYSLVYLQRDFNMVAKSKRKCVCTTCVLLLDKALDKFIAHE